MVVVVLVVFCGGGEAGGCGGGGGCCGGVSLDNRLKVTLTGNRNNAVLPADVSYSVSSWWLYCQYISLTIVIMGF